MDLDNFMTLDSVGDVDGNYFISVYSYSKLLTNSNPNSNYLHLYVVNYYFYEKKCYNNYYTCYVQNVIILYILYAHKFSNEKLNYCKFRS